MSGTIDYSSSDGIARLTISQPEKHNALTLAMWRAIPALVARAIDEQDVRVIALTGAGNSAFSAGADISHFAVERDGAVAVQAYDEAVAAAETALVQAAKPTLALVTGLCFGGGVGLASSCDIRLVNASARFRVPAARRSLKGCFRPSARCSTCISATPCFASAETEIIISPAPPAMTSGRSTMAWSCGVPLI